MKKLTLNQAWRLCLKQWKWMIEQLAKNPNANIENLKNQWLQDNGLGDVYNSCFFCEYDDQFDTDCTHCPACLIDSSFNCLDDEYSYEDKPHKFYAKLLELDKKRKSKKVK